MSEVERAWRRIVSSSAQRRWGLAGGRRTGRAGLGRAAGGPRREHVAAQRWTMASTARWPRTLFPAGSSGGENVPIAKRPGTTATMPPPTPLFAGTPTL